MHACMLIRRYLLWMVNVQVVRSKCLWMHCQVLRLYIMASFVDIYNFKASFFCLTWTSIMKKRRIIKTQVTHLTILRDKCKSSLRKKIYLLQTFSKKKTEKKRRNRGNTPLFNLRGRLFQFFSFMISTRVDLEIPF